MIFFWYKRKLIGFPFQIFLKYTYKNKDQDSSLLSSNIQFSIMIMFLCVWCALMNDTHTHTSKHIESHFCFVEFLVKLFFLFNNNCYMMFFFSMLIIEMNLTHQWLNVKFDHTPKLWMHSINSKLCFACVCCVCWFLIVWVNSNIIHNNSNSFWRFL